MALSTTQYGYIIDPMVPFTDDKGKTIKNGFVRVFVAGSSTPVITYRNFDGAANQDLIELDNSGRTKTSVIGSKGLTYKVCVYDKHHSQESPILTVDKVSVIGANITAGTGATVVTGLDGLTTKPDGFVDASVVGTDGYVALDHTLVTDDLDTDAKVTAVENERYVPLLNDDVNDPDSKITLKFLKQWVLRDNTGTIYPTLQDAIPDATNLSVGDIFETNGFHTSGDGGAARYRVYSTGTADGINTILMSPNKYAVLQRFDTIYPVEQSVTESDLRLYATTSANTKINDSGNLVTDATFTLYRFNNLVSHSVLVIETDGNCVFSASPSINDKIGDVIKCGANVVPSCGHWLLCSASNSYGTPKVRLYNNSAGDQAAKIAYGYDRLASAYNTSVGSGIDDYGSITSDASKTITRFNNLNEGDIVRVETDDKFIFSESASGTGRVGYPRKSGVYVVPKGVSWMLVASSSSLAPVVNIIDRSTKLEDYGIRINKSATPSIRLGRAGNFNYSLNSARNAVSDFDNCFPWNQMRVCNISITGGIRTVVYEGQAGFSYTNDTFVEVPAFYFKRVVHDNYEDWYVSNHGGDGFELEPWFKDGYGNKLAVRYVARFVHSNNGISRVGQPTVVKPKSFFKTEFESNGFELMSIYGYQALQHLLVVELGTKNTQSVFNGVSNYKYIANGVNVITSASGSTNYVEIAAGDVRNTYFAVGDQVVIFPTSSTNWSDGIVRTLTDFYYDSNVIKFTFDGDPISITSGVSSIFGCMQNNGKCNSVHTNGGMQSTGPMLTRSFLWRGIENIYGNLGEFADLINYDFDANRLYVQGEYLTFQSPYSPNYIDGPTPSYIFSMGVDKNYPTLTLPTSTTTNPNSGFCDDWSTFGSGGNGDVVYGCAWDHLTGNGAFCLRAVTSETNNLLYTGRAML